MYGFCAIILRYHLVSQKLQGLGTRLAYFVKSDVQNCLLLMKLEFVTAPRAAVPASAPLVGPSLHSHASLLSAS